jgi:molybdopterin-binding protein
MRNGENTPHFLTDGGTLRFMVASDADSGPGSLILRSEDVTVSRQLSESSAQNAVHGAIIDIIRVPGGMEVLIDAQGVELAAMLTHESVRQLLLSPGLNIYATFKATAARFLGDE